MRRLNSTNRAKFLWLKITLLVLIVFLVCAARVALSQGGLQQGWFYKELAVSLATGHGFAQHAGPWRYQPAITRPPLWPLILSLPMRACPACNPVSITRYLTAFMHAWTALAGGLLVWLLTRSSIRSIAIIAAITLWPEAQTLLTGGFCEPFATALLVTGIVLLTCDWFYSGVAVLSLLLLVRPNFLLLWEGIIVLLWWKKKMTIRRLAAATLLFYLPSAVWITRNYLVSGMFPVLAGTASLTFYGNYNPVSATWGPRFGRWVDPRTFDRVRLSETDSLRYYDAQAKQFVVHHWQVVPPLLAAHVVRIAFPNPNDRSHEYLFWVFRLILYAATAIALRSPLDRGSTWFSIVLTSAVATTALTVVTYSADTRYLYPLHILLMLRIVTSSSRLKALKSEHHTERIAMKEPTHSVISI